MACPHCATPVAIQGSRKAEEAIIISNIFDLRTTSKIECVHPPDLMSMLCTVSSSRDSAYRVIFWKPQIMEQLNDGRVTAASKPRFPSLMTAKKYWKMLTLGLRKQTKKTTNEDPWKKKSKQKRKTHHQRSRKQNNPTKNQKQKNPTTKYHPQDKWNIQINPFFGLLAGMVLFWEPVQRWFAFPWIFSTRSCSHPVLQTDTSKTPRSLEADPLLP